MVKILFQNQEIDVDTLDDFFEKHFDKSLLDGTNTLYLTHTDFQEGRRMHITYNYLENAERRNSFSMFNKLQEGDYLGICSKKFVQHMVEYSN
jgi:hypothetical protein